MVIVDRKVTAAASVELVGLFYLCSRSLLSTHATASHRAPGGQPRSAARVLIQWQNPSAAPSAHAAFRINVGGQGSGRSPAAQACHMRRRRTLACQGRPCSPSGTNSWRPSTVGCGPFEKTRAPPGLQFTGPLMRRRIHACHMRRRRTLACHWTFHETHLIAAGLQGAKCSQVYLRMRRAFHDWMTNAQMSCGNV